MTLLLSVFAITLGTVFYILYVINTIDARMEQLSSSRASLFFALYPPYKAGQKFLASEFKDLLNDQGFLEKKSREELVSGTFAVEGTKDEPEYYLHRIPFRMGNQAFDHLRVKLKLKREGAFLHINEIKRLNPEEDQEKVDIPPKKISAYYAGRVRTQTPVGLSDIPVSVRHAVMAIEDVRFLEHSGISPRSILRALIKDLASGKKAEGGSTITQQLMKNLFFTRKKSWTRKGKEAVFALITELRHSKEDILVAYLNDVYLGQWATQEIHGVSEGARFYFNQSIADISLSQSATLAALVQSPNAYDPHKNPAPLLNRRNLVLKKMFEADFILKDEYDFAIGEPLGITPKNRVLEDVGYFMDLVMNEIPESLKNQLDTDALSIYTTLNPFLQSIATRALRDNLTRLLKDVPAIKKREEKGVHLQSALIAIDVPTCSVVTLQGGSSYRQTQFNRVLQGKRQPGSLFKPFVYIAAFANPPPDGPITAITELSGVQFDWKYDGQTWRPKNYDKEYPEKVTARKALENSINVPTASLAQKIGIPPIVDTIQRSGIQSRVPSVPSIILGSADVTPFELAESFTTLANIGKGCKPRPLVSINDEKGNPILESKPEFIERLPATATFLTNHILKGVFATGTAKFIQGWGVDTQYFAGKTGTTNEYKDAWFVGYSPEILALVWVGYDEEAKVGLTGAVAALPLWSDFMKSAQGYFKLTEFAAPDGLLRYDIDPDTLSLATARCPNRYPEYFIQGTQPTNTCMRH